jgi:predicted RNase H-like HicB family nuclease
MKVRDVIRRLEDDGWYLVATRGSLRPVGEGSMMRYALVIEKANGNYSAYVPDLPGCVATGATVEETEQNIRDAIRSHLKGLREDGAPVPAPTAICEYVEA